MNELPLDMPRLLAIAAALGFASGVRLYAVLLLIGLAGHFEWAPLPAGLHILSHPWVLACLAVASLMEFLADKLPWVDSLWDALHTFIRLPAGGALAVALAGGQGDAMAVILGLIGGTFAAGSHFAKAGTRAVVNSSPEPFSNIALSLAEDVLMAGFAWLIATHPLLAGMLALVGVLIALWLVRVLWRGVRNVLEQVRNLRATP